MASNVNMLGVRIDYRVTKLPKDFADDVYIERNSHQLLGFRVAIFLRLKQAWIYIERSDLIYRTHVPLFD